MSVQNERRRVERRQGDANAEDELSPEYLALLEVCGGEIRASDRAVLAERREAIQAEAQAAMADAKKEGATQALPAADRRRARTT
jgi:hypothetical protein